MMYPAAFARVRPVLKPEHFVMDQYRRIWRAMCALGDEGVHPDPIAIKTWADREQQLDALGGTAILAKLAATPLPALMAPHYATIIRDMWRRRALVELLDSVREPLRTPQPGEMVNVIADDITSRIFDICDDGDTGTMAQIGVAARSVLAEAEATHRGGGERITTGFVDLDAKLGSLQRGGLYVVGGRPGMGKTSLALWASYHVACTNKTVLFVSLETKGVPLARRLLSGLTRIENDRIDRAQMTVEEFGLLNRHIADLQDLPIIYDEGADQTLAGIEARARMLSHRRKLGLIVVDHIGLIAPPRDIARHGLTQAVEHASNGLKRIARTINCPVMVLCQLNRGLENREDKRPGLADLRQSGAIEQDADAVMFVYRQHYYLQRKQPERIPGEPAADYGARIATWKAETENLATDAEVIIAKQRDGGLGTVPMIFEEQFARWNSAATDYGAQP